MKSTRRTIRSRRKHFPLVDRTVGAYTNRRSGKLRIIVSSFGETVTTNPRHDRWNETCRYSVATKMLPIAAGTSQQHPVRFVVLHRPRLSPWAYASLPVASHSASSLPLWFSFLSVFVDFHFFVATLNCHSRDLVVARLLTPHRQMEVHVQVLAHATETFVVFRSYQGSHQVQQQALG